jgi:hypothetical protein
LTENTLINDISFWDKKGDTYFVGTVWMKIVVFLAILLALGGWSMVFLFQKNQFFCPLFSVDKKPERSGVHKLPTLCFGIVKWERGTPRLGNSSLVIGKIVY